MYKMFIVGIMSLLFANVALAGESEQFRLLFTNENEDGNSSIYVFTDPETQCEYLTYFHSLTESPSLTPRLNAQGKPMCKDFFFEFNEDIKSEAESFESVE